MSMPTETALEYLLAIRIRERAEQLKNRHVSKMERGPDGFVPQDKIPLADAFIDESVDELNRDRERIISRLTQTPL